MKKLLPFLIIFLLIFIFPCIKALAANIAVSLPSAVNVGDNFEVLVTADSDGVLINSVNIILDYNQDLMSFSGYKESSAVVGLWVDSPHEENGNVYMSGIIPGGVSGLYDPNKQGLGSIPLVRLLFTAKREGNARFSFIKTQILKHDGKGTELAHDEAGGELIIKNNDISKKEEIIDKEKPESFDITFLESSIFSKTPSMIIFRANDIGSGIREYQMNTGGSAWQKVQSPQPISRGILARTITIRAFDFSDNFQDAYIKVPGIIASQFLWPILVLLTIGCILGYKMIRYKM